jgi:hypothetical protein
MDGTASFAEEILDDLYKEKSQVSYRGKAKKHDGKGIKSIRLTPLQTSSISNEEVIVTQKGLYRSQSLASSPRSRYPQQQQQYEHRSPVLLPKSSFPLMKEDSLLLSEPQKAFKKGSRVDINDNIHYDTHLRHKISNLSGISPVREGKHRSESTCAVISPTVPSDLVDVQSLSVGSSESPIPALLKGTAEQQFQAISQYSAKLSRKVEELQYQLLQESTHLSSLMSSIGKQYEKLKGINENVLIYRREIGLQVQEINENYVKLIEEILKEMMKIQRVKFKVNYLLSRYILFYNSRSWCFYSG